MLALRGMTNGVFGIEGREAVEREQGDRECKAARSNVQESFVCHIYPRCVRTSYTGVAVRAIACSRQMPIRSGDVALPAGAWAVACVVASPWCRVVYVQTREETRAVGKRAPYDICVIFPVRLEATPKSPNR